MILLKPTGAQSSNNGQKCCRRSCRVVTYPPPSTGTNYNLIDKVEHDASDRVIWHIVNSPDGRFVYGHHLIEQKTQRADRMCLDCHRVKVHGLKRLCLSCANSRKRASNRKSQSNRRSNVRKTGFSSLRAEALTKAVQTSRYKDSARVNLAHSVNK